MSHPGRWVIPFALSCSFLEITAASATIFARGPGGLVSNFRISTCAAIRAERRLGELLKREVPKAKGQLLRGDTLSPRGNAPTYAEKGIDKKQASRWQQLAAVHTLQRVSGMFRRSSGASPP